MDTPHCTEVIAQLAMRELQYRMYQHLELLRDPMLSSPCKEQAVRPLWYKFTACHPHPSPQAKLGRTPVRASLLDFNFVG